MICAFKQTVLFVGGPWLNGVLAAWPEASFDRGEHESDESILPQFQMAFG